jgi:preprotein translocase subunit SecY
MNFFTKIALIFKDRSLRRRFLFVAVALLLFRVLSIIPIPSIDTSRIEQFFAENQFFGLFNIFSGGGLANLSIVMLGVGPYITASIIMQLMTMMSARLKALYHEEGEAGRRRFMQYSRLLTIPLAVLSGYGFLSLLQNQGVINDLTTFETMTNIIIITAGSVLLMWIGELINEFGIGNGVSLIIFAGIVAAIPGIGTRLWFTIDASQIPLMIAFVVAAFLIILGVVIVTEAERPIPVTYAKRVRGMKVFGGVSTYIPLRVNQAGVIPIIFALSILLLPQMILNMLSYIDSPFIAKASSIILGILEMQWLYAVLYFALVFLFTYFYTAVTFDPHSIATNLQKNGAFVPGVRPGQATADYIGTVLTRITFVGALFLSVIAVLPLILQSVTGNPLLTIGGTALLIVVAVVIDFMKKLDGELTMREY